MGEIENKDIELAHIEQPTVHEHHGGHKTTAEQYADEAARILAEAGGGIDITMEENKRVLRTIDLWVLIPMCLTYLLQQLDKSTLSYAAVFQLQAETGLVGSQYSWLTSIVYCTELVFQPLSSYALIVFPVKWWVVFNIVAWSIVTACTSAAKNFTGLIICRALLGCFEATILPSFIMITQMWWTRREQSYRTMAVQVANSGAVFIGPLLSYAVGHVKDGLLAYQSIFLFMGCLTLALTPYIAWSLPNSPADARFLRKGNDRLVAIERIRENNTGMKATKINWKQVREVFIDPKSYMWAAMYFCTACPSGGIGAFGGLITEGFGFNTFDTILMQMPTGAIGILTLLISMWITNKIRARWIVIFCVVLGPIGGAAALTKISRSNTGGLMAAYYVIWLYGGIQPLLYSWANLNAGGTTKRVVVFAFMFTFQCAGNIVGPQLYLSKEAPYYQTGLHGDIACWAILCVLICVMRLYLGMLNRRQARRRVAAGLPEELEDMSIMTAQEAEEYKIKLTQMMAARGGTEASLYENAFADVTDFENPTFIYVL